MIPSLFIAHGAPLLALEDNEYTQLISRLGLALPRPKAVVLFSAHWVTSVQRVSAVNEYDTMYDFGGFPEALYQIKYPAKGDAEVARKIGERFAQHGVAFELDPKRGLDHGAWVILRLLYPEANIPVIAMSVNPRLRPEEQYGIGKALADLRSEDVLIIGSGGTVHNLGALEWQGDHVSEWALEFDDWLERHLKSWDLDSLYQYETLAPNAKMAVPPFGNEHFVPIFYAMGAADDMHTATLLHRNFRYGNLSQSIWQFG